MNFVSSSYLERTLNLLRPLQEKLLEHELYARIRSLEDFRVFMEHHVFAVWDFMSQLKALQGLLTCTSIPWLPRGDTVSRRLINAIVLEEESDEDGAGGFTSHFELYRRAMLQAGADVEAIDEWLRRLERSEDFEAALGAADLGEGVENFLRMNWEVTTSESPHRIAAAFALGRERVVPAMFRCFRFEEGSEALDLLRYYFARHIDLDEGQHEPMAMRMLQQLCGEDAGKWEEVAATAILALEARLRLWDAVSARLREPRNFSATFGGAFR